MYRFAENTLEKWLQNPYRKPLVIRGARQVGKSTLVRNFASKQNLNLIEINLERHLELEPVFKTFDTSKIIKEIEGLTGQNPLSENTLLFLDEIQSTPSAIQALRYFYEDYPQIPVISAGSLLEHVLSDHQFSMPVGRVEYLFLGPMTFEEYLIAKSSELNKYLNEFDFTEQIPQTAHHRLLEHMREYFFTGGMPEAISRFLQTNQIQQAMLAQQSIILTYQDDFAKYSNKYNLQRLHRIFNYVPAAIGNKIKYSQISREDKSRELKPAIDLLIKARVIAPVYHSHCSGIPLSVQKDEHIYKLIFLDIGLTNKMCGMDWSTLSKMDEIQLVNEGPVAEQFIGQHLLFRNDPHESPELFYWIREQKTSNAEIDYVISRGNHIIPIEVKAGKSGTLKSLLQFVKEKKGIDAIRFDANLPSIQKIQHALSQNSSGNKPVQYRLTSLPLYMVSQTNRIIDIIKENVNLEFR